MTVRVASASDLKVLIDRLRNHSRQWQTMLDKDNAPSMEENRSPSIRALDATVERENSYTTSSGQFSWQKQKTPHSSVKIVDAKSSQHSARNERRRQRPPIGRQTSLSTICSRRFHRDAKNTHKETRRSIHSTSEGLPYSYVWRGGATKLESFA